MNYGKLISLTSIASLLILGSCTLFGPAKKAEPSLAVVNVLDKELFDDCTPKGSINVPMEQVDAFAEKNWDKEKTNIVVFCANYKCTASGAVAKQLLQKGYKHVWAFEGGTAEWKHKGYPTAGPCKSGYLNDFEPFPGAEEPDVPVITAEELKQKMEQFGIL